MMLPSWIEILRIPHWVKNAIVFAMVVFLDRLRDADAWGSAGVAFGAFCLAASAVYALNDVFDCQADARHEDRRDRPLPSGRMTQNAALVEALLLALGALGLTWVAQLPGVAVWVGAYILLNIVYDWRLKRLVVLDAACISTGFVFRLLAASSALNKPAPPWLVMGTFSLCLCVSFGKRLLDNGFVVAGSENSGIVGAARYTRRSLRNLLVLSGTAAALAYLLYATAPGTRVSAGTPALLYTLPLVVLGIVRYSRLCLKNAYHNLPTLILKDHPLQWIVIAWMLLCAWVFAAG